MCQVQYSASYESNLRQQHLPQMRAYIDNVLQPPNGYVRTEAGPGEASLLKLVWRCCSHELKVETTRFPQLFKHI